MENKGKNKSNFTWIKENFEEYKNKTQRLNMDGSGSLYGKL